MTRRAAGKRSAPEVNLREELAHPASIAPEIKSWVLIGALALAVAGVFGFLLALSRVPGIENYAPWAAGFFTKGLVIHVVFSLVIWFLTVFALLTTQATADISGGAPKLAFLGRIGLAFVSMSFPMLFVPAFHHDTVATLNNYIPVIIHPGYYLGLTFLALGILLPVIRLLANLDGRLAELDAIAFAMTMAGIVYAVSLVSFAAGLKGVWGEVPSRSMHETLFWGGGHVLQFLYCILMLTGWTILGRKSFGKDIVDPDIFRLSVGLIGVFSLGALIFCMAFKPFTPVYSEGFRRLQFVLAFPSLLIAGSGLSTVLRERQLAPLPWRRPAFVALVTSPMVFAVGGIMGLLITTSDTRTPAHYHGVIAGVQLACMGLILSYSLPRLTLDAKSVLRQRLQLALFGFGQIFASIGLFMAGGYGAPRKTPSGAVNLADGAAAGMFLHGIGALFAVVGGILFVVTILQSLFGNGPRTISADLGRNAEGNAPTETIGAAA